MLRNILYLTFTFSLTLVMISSNYAQQAISNSSVLSELSDDEEIIRQQLVDFAKAYSDLPDTKDKNAILKYFSPELKSNIFYFGITGKSRIQQSDFEGFGKYLDKIIRSESLTLTYDIQNVLQCKAINNRATAVFEVVYEIKEEDGIWIKGTETVSWALLKSKNGWRTVQLNVMGFEDEKLKGSCLCELFVSEAEDGEVVAKTTIPNGQDYVTHFNNFNFQAQAKANFIKSGDEVFKWNRGGNGQIYWVTPDSEDKEVGKASNKKEAVLLLVKDYLYSNSCSSLRLKSK